MRGRGFGLSPDRAACKNWLVVDSLKGRLLVAAPELVDPNFHRTVVLMLEHNEDGALGVVLNRPSETSLTEILPDWQEAASEPGTVFVGGPVQQTVAICLARAVAGSGSDVRPGGVDFEPVIPEFGIGTVDLAGDALDADSAFADLRVYAGYAGWAPGQLEGELEVGGWYVVEAKPEDAFSRAPSRLWSDVLARQKGSLALVASFPPDPSMN